MTINIISMLSNETDKFLLISSCSVLLFLKALHVFLVQIYSLKHKDFVLLGLQ